MYFKSFLAALCFLAAGNIFAQSSISDADGNTNVKTEAFPNNNQIQLTTNGLPRMTVRGNAAGKTVVDFFNTNEGVYLGANAGLNLTIGIKNTVVGNNAGVSLSSGGNNTFLGQIAGTGTTTGSDNVAVGSVALISNTTGTFNVAVGSNSLQQLVSGSNNTAVGNSSLVSNTASDNTAVGSNALQNSTTGLSNTAIGRRANQLNTTGGTNTAVGALALNANTTGFGNAALGANAGDLAAGNNNCTFLGNNTDNTLNTNLSNSTVIGSGGRINASNKIRFGNTAVTVIEGQVAYTTSDGRFKKEVKADAPGLDFVMGLKPVTYHFDYTGFSKFLGEEGTDMTVLQKKEQYREMGFIAQEVEGLCQKQGLDISNIVHTPESDIDNYSVAYGQMVVPLVKAVQEQQAQIDELRNLVTQLIAAQTHAQPASPAEISVWPNPAGDVLYLSASSLTDDSAITMLGPDGRFISTQKARGSSNQVIDMQQCAPGVYFIQVQVPGRMPVTTSVVKH